MNITTPSFYVNDLEIPQAIAQPSIQSNTPTPNAKLIDCITYVERRVLLNSLGLLMYNELQTALSDLPASDQKWKDLVNGKEYDGKVWIGLGNAKSLLCYAVRVEFLDQNSTYWSTFGITKPDAENAKNITPAFEIASTYQKFIEKYQGGFSSEPFRYYEIGVSFVDYYGNHNNVDVSLFQYLRDNIDVYGWSQEFFKGYENTLNSFGL